MGKKKISLSERARRAGLPPDVVEQRIRLGWSLRRALITPVGHTRANSISAQARKAGIGAHMVLHRVRVLGWPLAVALSTPSQRDHTREVRRRAQEAHLDPKLVLNRLHKGWPLIEALTPKLPSREPTSQSQRGKRNRIYRGKLVETASALLGRRVTYREAQALFKTLREASIIGREPSIKPSAVTLAARKAGLQSQTVKARMRLGMSLEQALAIPGRTDYGRWTVLAREARLDPRLVRDRIYRGWSEKRALATPPLR